jgi:hypothetical protein
MIFETIMSRESLANLLPLMGHRFEFLYEKNLSRFFSIESLHIATDGPSVQIVSDDYNDQDAGQFEIRMANSDYQRKCFEAGWVFLRKRHQIINNIYVVRATYKNLSNDWDGTYDLLCERGIVLELEASCIYFNLSQPYSFLFDVEYLTSLDALDVPSRLEIFDDEPDVEFEYQLVKLGDLIEGK